METFLKLALTLLAICNCGYCDPNSENSVSVDAGPALVLTLTRSTYEKAIKTHAFLFVNFYASWSNYSKKLTPEFANAAQELADSGSSIKLAQVDAEKQPELAREQKVVGYPTLRFYRNGDAVEYRGAYAARDIIKWLHKKTSPPAILLKTEAEVQAFIEDADVVVGFFKDADSKAASKYLKAAADIYEIPTGIVHDAALARKFNVTGNAVVLFKQFDDRRNELKSGFSKPKIMKFVQLHMLPLVADLQTLNKYMVFGIYNYVVLLVSKDAGHYEQFVQPHKDTAIHFRGNVTFLAVNTDDAESAERILESLQLTLAETPAVRFFNTHGVSTGYRPRAGTETEMLGDPAAMKAFIQDVLDGKIKAEGAPESEPELEAGPENEPQVEQVKPELTRHEL